MTTAGGVAGLGATVVAVETMTFSLGLLTLRTLRFVGSVDNIE
jgi:hypothetical protein